MFLPYPLWYSPKSFGAQDPSCSVNICAGNPIHTSTGNKYQVETDFVTAPDAHIELIRTYNSLDKRAASLGINWRHTYERSILNGPGSSLAQLYRPDGRVEDFWLQSGIWAADPDVTNTLAPVIISGVQTGWKVTTSDDTTEYYNMAGQLNSMVTKAGLTTTLAYNANSQLATVTGPFGHVLSFTYNANGNVSQMTTPDGGVYAYAYNATNSLTSVTYPDMKVRQYVYENTGYPNALTGIIDESGNRYATYAYNAQGRAVSSQHAGGVDLTTITYNGSATTVTDARNHAYTYTFTKQFGITKPTGLTGVPTPAVGGKAFSYDANGFIASKTDYNNNLTTYTHDARGLETSRTEAVGKPEARTIATTWHPTFHLPTQIVESTRTTTLNYDANGTLLTKTLSAVDAPSKTWNYTYNASGQVLTVDGPRTDVNDITEYSYDAQGNLSTVTNPLGHVTHVTVYDANGRLLSMQDPNGLVTSLTYDPRGRLTSRSVGGETTTYAYDPAGNLTGVTMPDNAALTYTYDAAHRLTDMSDSLGNQIHYTLDVVGNRTQKSVYDPANTLTRTQSFAYDQINNLVQIIGAVGQTTTLGRDANGNVTSVTDPLGNIRKFQYDSLDQAIRELEPHPTVTGSTQGQIDTAYDGLGQVTRITDARSLATDYQVDSLGNLLSQTSPDTGTTRFTYDEAGNVKTRTDARGKSAQYSNDSLNRISQIVYEDQTVTYSWDNCTNGIGRLCSLTNNGSSVSYGYDSHGRLTAKNQTADGTTLVTSHSYNTLGQREQTVTPSGQTIGYVWLNGKINAITVNGQSLVSQIVYEPDGQIGGWTWGNGTLNQRLYDLSGRPDVIDLGFDPQGLLSETRTISYDAAGRITDLISAVNTSANHHHGYDGLDRLIATDQGQPVDNSFDYAYDPSGNRTAKMHNGSTETADIDPGSNRLQQTAGPQIINYSYDAAGNLIGDGIFSYGYNAEGRRISATATGQTISYGYNALGQRISKTVNGATTRYVYDEQGHLAGEYDASGQLIQEIVWLGDLPIAVLRPGATTPDIYYIHADHLGTPRQITQPSDNKSLWAWESEAFGANLPNQNPSGQGDFVFNLRFPGQYYDQETGLFYNYFRDYDPRIGRYIQSDPIGLKGGINTYTYVGNNPLTRIDPDGRFWGAALRLFLAFMPMIDLHMMAVDDVPSGGGCKIPNSSTKTLYRAVGPVELSDIQQTGQLINRGSAEGKYFTSSAENASDYAKQAVNVFGDPPYTTIKTEVSTSVLPSPVNVDGGIPAYVIPNEALPSLTPTVLDSMSIPGVR